nr:unnamed protein product [Callosobruchus analis]
MSGVLCETGRGHFGAGRTLRNLLLTFALCYWTVVLVLADTNGRLTPNSVEVVGGMSGVLCETGHGHSGVGRALRNLLLTFALCYWTVVLVLADTNARLTPNSGRVIPVHRLLKMLVLRAESLHQDCAKQTLRVVSTKSTCEGHRYVMN